MTATLCGHQRRLTTKCIVCPALDPGTERREGSKEHNLNPGWVRSAPQKCQTSVTGKLGEVCTGTSLQDLCNSSVNPKLFQNTRFSEHQQLRGHGCATGVLVVLSHHRTQNHDRHTYTAHSTREAAHFHESEQTGPIIKGAVIERRVK